MLPALDPPQAPSLRSPRPKAKHQNKPADVQKSKRGHRTLGCVPSHRRGTNHHGAIPPSLSKFLFPTLVSLAPYKGQIPKAVIRLRRQSAMAYCPQHRKERTLHLIEMRKVMAQLSILARVYPGQEYHSFFPPVEPTPLKLSLSSYHLLWRCFPFSLSKVLVLFYEIPVFPAINLRCTHNPSYRHLQNIMHVPRLSTLLFSALLTSTVVSAATVNLYVQYTLKSPILYPLLTYLPVPTTSSSSQVTTHTPFSLKDQ